jgi:hypothetical protein
MSRAIFDAPAVFADAHGFVMLHPFAAPEPLHDVREVVLMVGRDQDGHRPADDLLGGVAVQRLGSAIPARNRALQILADDGILARLDDGRQPQARFLGPLLLGNVPGEAARVHETTVLPQDAGVDEHMPDRAVAASYPGFAGSYRLAGPQPAQNVLDRVAVHVELCDAMPDVLAGGVTKHGQLRTIRAQDGAVGTGPVQADRGVVEEIGEFLLAAANAGFGSPLLQDDGRLIGRDADHQPVRCRGEVQIVGAGDHHATVAAKPERRHDEPQISVTEGAGNDGRRVGAPLRQHRFEDAAKRVDAIRCERPLRRRCRFHGAVVIGRHADVHDRNGKRAAEDAAQSGGDVPGVASAPHGGQRGQRRQLAYTPAQGLCVVGAGTDGVHQR